jgi:DNA-binding CsgD family transcriptional regulator
MVTKSVRYFFILLPLVFSGLQGFSQSLIHGVIQYDTTRWKPVASLSMIPDLSRMYEISNESILQESPIGPDGTFSFTTENIPPGDHLYRIHFTRKEDPRASLIIGGPDENHLFLVCNGTNEVVLGISGKNRLVHRIGYAGYPVNQSLREINDIVGFLDTLDYYGPAVNRDFVREAVYERLRRYADTCSNPLISLYAIYHSRFESDFPLHPEYYHKYLRKWKKEDSEYFTAFHAQLGITETQNPWVPAIAAILFLGMSGLYWNYRRKKKPAVSPFQSLTVQERKIFGLLKDGKSNKEISEICSISLSTVKTHVNSIYSKLNIQSRTDVMDFDVTRDA